MINKATYALHDYPTGDVLDTGAFTYDDYFFHLMEEHKGSGMICDVLGNSYLDEYLSHMLVEHINTITDMDQRIIYIHDNVEPCAGDYPYNSTPWFCVADHDDGDASDGTYTLAQLKPYMVLVLIDIVEIAGEGDDE